MLENKKYSIVLPLKIKNNIDIFFNINMLMYSYFLNKNDIDDFFIVCDENKIEYVKSNIEKYDLNINVIAEQKLFDKNILNYPVPHEGWFKQQIIKLAISEYSKSNYYIVLDDDLFLIKNLYYDDLFHNNKIKYTYEGWTDNSINYSNNTSWWENSCNMLKSDVEKIKTSNFNMGVTPQIFKTSHVKKLIQDIKNINNTEDWQKLFIDTKSTEYTSYWISLLNNKTENDYTTEGIPLWKLDTSCNILGNMEKETVERTVYKGLYDNLNYFFVIQSYLNIPSEYYKNIILEFIKKYDKEKIRNS
jgi:hypothetical protein